MKLLANLSSRRTLPGSVAQGGFTIMELMTVVGLFSLLVLAMVSSQVFGLRLYRISETKLSNTKEARNALVRVRSEIWSGKTLQVGNGDAYTFTLIPGNGQVRGNALRIFPTGDTNNYVYYYVDVNDTCLKRMVSGDKRIEIVADFVTNRVAFQAEDYQGTVATNYLNTRVVRMNLQFYKKEYSLANAQGQKREMGDYYQLQTKVARRAID